MIKVAVTGGIGCGKSFICQMLEHRGIHVYDCDKAAKRIMSLKFSRDLWMLWGKTLL